MKNKEYIYILPSKERVLVKVEPLMDAHMNVIGYYMHTDNKEYFFKYTQPENKKDKDHRNIRYQSLLIQKMAQQMGIPFPHTDLALFGGREGELQENFHKPNYQYIQGSKILKEYLDFNISMSQMEKIIPNYDKLYHYENADSEFDYNKRLDAVLLKLNNLPDIWNALELHFRKYPNKQQIVGEMMNSLANRFAFDFITMQRDRGDYNWEIEENEKEHQAHLTMLYDCNRSFYYPSFQVLMNPVDNMKANNEYDKLEYYLKVSLEEFCHYFYMMFDLFTPDKITEYIHEIMNKYDVIDTDELIMIQGSYQEHYERMRQVVERVRNRGRV